MRRPRGAEGDVRISLSPSPHHLLIHPDHLIPSNRVMERIGDFVVPPPSLTGSAHDGGATLAPGVGWYVFSPATPVSSSPPRRYCLRALARSDGRGLPCATADAVRMPQAGDRDALEVLRRAGVLLSSEVRLRRALLPPPLLIPSADDLVFLCSSSPPSTSAQTT